MLDSREYHFSLPVPALSHASKSIHFTIPAACKDILLEKLVRSILPPQDADELLRGFYTDVFHTALLKRLESIRCDSTSGKVQQKTLSLPEWRLKRVTVFVQQNLEKTITLSCIARAAGLSRMHFAALFRRTTGLRPHEYVVLQRIARSQQLLCDSQTAIVEIALSVGFQSQAHFTTIFKRVVGTTPHRWRLTHEPKDLAA